MAAESTLRDEPLPPTATHLLRRHAASLRAGDGMGAAIVELMPELARYVPPAETIDKPVPSPSWGSDLSAADSRADLVVSGGETDMCVLATALGAVEYLAIAQCSCRTRSAAVRTNAANPCSASSATGWPACGDRHCGRGCRIVAAIGRVLNLAQALDGYSAATARWLAAASASPQGLICLGSSCSVASSSFAASDMPKGFRPALQGAVAGELMVLHRLGRGN